MLPFLMIISSLGGKWYVPPQRLWRFESENGYRFFDHYGLTLDMVFKGITRVYKRLLNKCMIEKLDI